MNLRELAERIGEVKGDYVDKVTKLKGMIDTNNPASPTRAELDAL